MALIRSIPYTADDSICDNCNSALEIAFLFPFCFAFSNCCCANALESFIVVSMSAALFLYWLKTCFLVLDIWLGAVAADVAPVNKTVPTKVSTWVSKSKNFISLLKPKEAFTMSCINSSPSSSRISPPKLFTSCLTTVFLPWVVAAFFKLFTKVFLIPCPAAVLKNLVSGIIPWTTAVANDIPLAYACASPPSKPKSLPSM